MSGQRTLSLEMREFDPTDYPRLLEIYNANYPGYARSVVEWRSRDETVDRSKYYWQRYSFLERNAIVGFNDVSHVTDMFHPYKFWIIILVDPSSQGRGIGGSIYERLCGELGKLNALESRLDLRTMDPSRFRDYSEKVLRQGITITNLAAERDQDQNALRKLHELVQLISADMPSPSPFTPISFEQWKAFELKKPSLLPEGYMIAKDGSKFVGLSTVWRIDQEPRGLVKGNTGVRREYRGRGIAVALKLKVIDFARRNGYEKMKTWNASNNAPMLAVNTKLGFKREVGWITLEKDLA